MSQTKDRTLGAVEDSVLTRASTASMLILMSTSAKNSFNDFGPIAQLVRAVDS